jgi:apolipoprotein N-acyltransferase
VLFVLGAFGVLAHAPFFIWPAYGVALTALVLTLDDAKRRPKPLRSGFVARLVVRQRPVPGGDGLGGERLPGQRWRPCLADLGAADLLPAGLALFWGLAGAVYVQARSGSCRPDRRVCPAVMAWSICAAR